MNKRIRFPLFILVYVTSFLLIFNINISEERLLMLPQKQPSGMIDNELKSKNLIYGKVIFFKIGLENLDSNYKHFPVLVAYFTSILIEMWREQEYDQWIYHLWTICEKRNMQSSFASNYEK